MASLLLDSKGRLPSYELFDCTVRGALVVDQAMAGRDRSTRTGWEASPTSRGMRGGAMSASGTGLFDDDLASDVRDIYVRMLQDRVPDEEATRRSIEEWSGLGPDEEAVFWMALAAAQSAVGRLDDSVRDRALEIIDTGQDLERWGPPDEGLAGVRAAALAALRTTLTGPQPARKVVRRAWRYVTDLAVGAALAWRRSDGSVTVLRVAQIREDPFTGAVTPVLQRLAWTGGDVPPAQVLADLPAGDDVVGSGWDEPRGRPGAVIPLRLRKRDPDWADLGFAICGSVPARDGDEEDWELLTPHMEWTTLAFHLDQG